MSDFSDQLKSDLDTFINPEEFAEFTAVYNGIKEGVVINIAGIFDTPFATMDPSTEIVVQGTQPVFRVKEHELPGTPPRVRPGDWLLINGIEYWAKESQPDGVGTVRIELKIKKN